jgi:hypothetical protein
MIQLHPCPACLHSCSEAAWFCPSCGHPLLALHRAKHRLLFYAGLIGYLVWIGWPSPHPRLLDWAGVLGAGLMALGGLELFGTDPKGKYRSPYEDPRWAGRPE